MRPGKLFVFGPLDAFATVDQNDQVRVWLVGPDGLVKLQPSTPDVVTGWGPDQDYTLAELAAIGIRVHLDPPEDPQ